MAAGSHARLMRDGYSNLVIFILLYNLPPRTNCVHATDLLTFDSLESHFIKSSSLYRLSCSKPYGNDMRSVF